MVDCFYQIKGEYENGQTFMKRGVTNDITGEIVTLRFDQMEDVHAWHWMEVFTWTNQPEPEVPEQVDEEPYGDEGVMDEGEEGAGEYGEEGLADEGTQAGGEPQDAQNASKTPS